MNLLEQFKAFVQSNHLLAGDQRTLLAVSGGVDSVVMAHLFKEADYSFGIAHCNFQLRGEESDGDEFFVQQLAADFEVSFFVKHFETKTYAEQHGLSVQMAARELRYDWFREIAAENDFARIATAHNLNDSVETALLNFVRGTGLSGLRGIAVNPTPDPTPTGRGDVEDSRVFTTLSSTSPLPVGVGSVRPLLFASRADIETYASTHNLLWRGDSSNASDDYARNFMRHHVVPLLEQLNPNFLRTAERNLARLRETDENLRFLLRHFFEEKTASENEFSIDKQKLAQLPAPRRALRGLLKHEGFTEEQARQVAENLDHIGLELHSNSGWRLVNDRQKILLAQSPIQNLKSQIPIYPDDLMVSLPDGGKLLLIPPETTTDFPDGREAVTVDAEKLYFPLTLRPWQPGDVFQPFGMGGHRQKLQDFFTNLKLSRLDKEKIRVLVNGDGAIIWVAGYRLDERFKVMPSTNKFLKISIVS